MTYAHYYTGKLIINSSMQPIGGITIACTGVREARRIAKQHNAKPWNF